MNDPYRKAIPRREDGTSDIYDVLFAYQVRNPAVEHAIKKLLCPGVRGAKGVLQDLEEARKSIVRAIELEQHALVAMPAQFNCPPLCSKCHTLHHASESCSVGELRSLPDYGVRKDSQPGVVFLQDCPGCGTDPEPHARSGLCSPKTPLWECARCLGRFPAGQPCPTCARHEKPGCPTYEELEDEAAKFTVGILGDLLGGKAKEKPEPKCPVCKGGMGPENDGGCPACGAPGVSCT